MMELHTPISEEDIAKLRVKDVISLSGNIFCGRDAVLPLIVSDVHKNRDAYSLRGGVIFHTAVSCAGVGPTSSNKLEIENSMISLSKTAGIKIHLGKGAIKQETVNGLADYNAVYAILPPVTALLAKKTGRIQCIAYPELGMEAFYCIEADNFPAIIAAANGESIYDE